MARKNIQTGIVCIGISLLLGFFAAGYNGFLGGMNTAIHDTLLLPATSLWFSFTLVATNLGSFSTIALVSLLVCAALFLRRRFEEAVVWLLGIGVAGALSEVLKSFFELKRPLDGLIPSMGGSYPSGHTTAVFALATVLLFVFIPKIKSRIARVLCAALAIGAATLVAYSRLALGVHWFTDVIGGTFLGTGAALAAIGLYKLANSQN